MQNIVRQTFEAIFILFFFMACHQIDKKDSNDTEATQKVPFDLHQSFNKNPFTGQEIKEAITYSGDTLTPGIKTAFKFQTVNTDTVKPALNITDLITIDTISIDRHEIDFSFKDNYLILNRDSLIDETISWIDTSQKITTDFGDTLPTNKKFKVEIRPVNVRWPKPIPLEHLDPIEGSDFDVGTLDINNGLPSSKINRVRTDPRGNIWIATRGGLSMYDGQHLFNFDRRCGLSSEVIYMVYCDQQNRVWFATLDGHLYYIENGLFYEVDQSLLAGLTISEMEEDSKGNIWMATELLGMLKFDGEYFTRYGFEEGLVDEILAMEEDQDGNLWLSTFGYGLIKWDGTNADYYTTENGLLDDYGSQVLVASDQSIWWATDYGLVRLKEDTLWNIGEEQGLKLTYCYDLAEDENGNIWYTADEGFGYVSSSHIVHTSYSIFKKDRSMYSIIVDQEQNKWIGAPDGLFKLNTFSFYAPFSAEVMDRTVLSSVYSLNDTMYLGSREGDFFRYHNDQIIRYQIPAPYNEIAISKIGAEPNGTIWFNAYRHLIKFDGKHFYAFGKEQGLHTNSFSDLHIGKNGTVYFATWEGLFQIENDEIKFLGVDQGLPYGYIFNVQLINDEVWIGHGLGISVLEKDSMRHYLTKNGLAAQKSRSVKSHNDQIIVSYLFDGINIISDDSIQWLNTNNGLKNNQVWYDLIIDDKYWAFTNKGIQIFDLSSGTFQQSGSIDINNGLKSNKVMIAHYNPRSNEVQLINDGHLLVAELSSFETKQISKPHLKYFEVNDGLYFKAEEDKVDLFPINQEVILEDDENDLGFYFGTIIQSPLHSALYTYRLSGLEDHWSMPTSNSEVHYKGLSHGQYTLEIKVKDPILQSWSIPTTFSFRILPPWYHTPWSYALYLLLFLALGFAILKWRTSQLLKKQKLLESKVYKATSTIRKQKDELEIRNEEIMDSIKYAKRLQEAVLPPQKLVKEWLTNSFILFKPKEIVSGDFYWMETIQFSKDDKPHSLVLFAVADCTGHGVPGAMVSVVCAGALNRAINEYKLTDVGAILDKVSELVVAALNKNKADVKDGMDIALCGLDIGNKVLYASGANNPIWIVSKAENITSNVPLNKYSTPNQSNCHLFELKGLKQPIGLNDRNESFNTSIIQLQPGDSIYLFSDGYADQFGGEKGKKFKYNNFRNLLMENFDTTMSDQKTIIDDTFETWRGDQEQIDDVCVIGVKINGKERNNFTSRELEVIEHLAQGLPSKLIADKMNISVHTVNTYRRRILSKTNCFNTTELVNYVKKKEII